MGFPELHKVLMAPALYRRCLSPGADKGELQLAGGAVLDAALAAKGQSRAGTRAGEPHTASTRRWLWATTRCPWAPQPPQAVLSERPTPIHMMHGHCSPLHATGCPTPPGFTHPTTITPRTTPFHHEQQCSISATVTHPALLPSLPSCNLEQPKHNEKVNPQKSISHWNGTFAPNKRPRAPRYTCTRTAEHNPW